MPKKLVALKKNETLPSLELSESDTKELSRILKIYWKEANKCKENKLYLSGCIIIGAILECSLILMVSCYSDEVIATKIS